MTEMVGLGTVINTAAIVAGGVLGKLFGRFLSESAQESLTRVCGVSTLFIAIAGALEGMMKVQGDSLVSGQSLLIICCLALGALIGEMLGIEDGLKRFGEWLKRKTGNERDAGFVNAFVTTSLTVCVGAMAIVGAIEDGINGDYSILATKAVLDLIIVIVMTGSMGKGCAFSAIPVAILQGSVTALAGLLRPVMTAQALANLSLIGSVLIFCVGVNLVWDRGLKVANMLPALVLAVGAAFLPGI